MNKFLNKVSKLQNELKDTKDNDYKLANNVLNKVATSKTLVKNDTLNTDFVNALDNQGLDEDVNLIDVPDYSKQEQDYMKKSHFHFFHVDEPLHNPANSSDAFNVLDDVINSIQYKKITDEINKVNDLNIDNPQKAMNELVVLEHQGVFNLEGTMDGATDTERIGRLSDLEKHYRNLLKTDSKSNKVGCIKQDKSVLSTLSDYKNNHTNSKLWLHMSLNWPKYQFSVAPVTSSNVSRLISYLY